MRSLFTLSALLLSSLFFAGCATLFTGTHDEVIIRSEPEGARIFIDGLEEGRTPAYLDIKRPGIGDTEVELRLDGYETRTFVLRKEFNAVSVINLTCLICWAVDVATGSVTKYRPLGYDVELDAEGQAYRMDELPQDEQGRYVVSLKENKVVVTDPTRGLYLVFRK